jgi:ABC-type branched-subunit amino acid transport system ATPase component/ABC-type branched-subunit amino acid transport system permease subunit
VKFNVAVLILGLTTGLTYAILSIGLMLIYKSARFVNFAHGQLGALSALLVAKAVNDRNVNYWLALVLALALAAAVAALVELVVVRRLFDGPRLVLMVATIGVAQLLYAVSFLKQLRPDPLRLVQQGYPTPIDWSVTIGGQVVGGAQFMILIFVPLAALALTWLFRSTAVGLRIQAVAANPEAARLAGISVRRVSTTVWVLAGTLAALTAVLLGPSRGSVNTETLGPGLMARALTVALVAGMTRLPVAFGAGIALGVIEQLVFLNFARGGTTELLVFLLALGALLWRARDLGRVTRRADESLPFTSRPRPLPAELAGRPWARWLRPVGVTTVVAAAAVLPFIPGLDDQNQAFAYTQVIAYSLVGLSLLVVTGWSGQFSLGQFAFVGIGAYAASRLAAEGFSLPFNLVVGAVLGAVVAAVVGLPALKIRGLFLGVSTLAFAVLAPGWLFNQRFVTGSSASAVSVPKPRVPGLGEVESLRALYLIGLLVLVLVAAGLRSVRSSGAGRRFIAVRDNPRAAAAHGLPPAGVNLAGFALSGALAALGGVLWGYANANFDATAFHPSFSLAVLAMVVIGGLGTQAGAVIGASLVFGLPLLLHMKSETIFLLSGALLLLTLLVIPRGLVVLLELGRDVVARLLDRVFRRRARAAPPEPALVVDLAEPDEESPTPSSEEPNRNRLRNGVRKGGEAQPVALECTNVSVTFGGLRALEAVTLRVDAGEIVALIGANGAGKTTLMECISGFVRPSEGSIRVYGRDLAGLAPEYRPWAGVGRSFQDARLYPGLTVLETVVVAAEHDDHSGLLSCAVRAPWQRWSERELEGRATAVLETLGLVAYRDVLTADLPTGLRRACEVACALVLQPRLLLLDEPTAGIPQADVPAFLPLIRRVRDELDCALLLIEHDMGVVLGLADRIYALEAGRVIASGPPAEVAQHPAVVATYLGEEQVAIARTLDVTTVGSHRPR